MRETVAPSKSLSPSGQPPQKADAQDTGADELGRINWARVMLRVGLVALVVAVFLVLWLSNLYFTALFSQAQRSFSENRAALYSSRIISELQRASVLPLLLSRDPNLISALEQKDFTLTSQRLIDYQSEIGTRAIFMLDKHGLIVASSNRRMLGERRVEEPIFINALRASRTVFISEITENEPSRFYYARRMDSDTRLGVLVVEVDLRDLFNGWRNSSDILLLTNASGHVIEASITQASGRPLKAVLSDPEPTTLIQSTLRQMDALLTPEPQLIYFEEEQRYRLDIKVPFLGWRLTYLSRFEDVRARVNGLLALEVMGIALLAALVFYLLTRRAIRQSFLLQAESQELRQLNARLSTEIAAREEAQRSLLVAEQSLIQSSKLAALGEMSAAVSHELNQPLAAMRTYLAGARLLLARARSTEAAGSLERIDDLIDRMGVITRQLKSYARKGSTPLEPIDLRASVHAALEMMAPQLSKMEVSLVTTLPPEPVVIKADAGRIEQVIVNLLRNALDATRDQAMRKIEILLVLGEMAELIVTDNGSGLDNLDALFEPFYTTKKPGEGVGLGLAISSDIAKDLGGRLTARNGPEGGAVFMLALPVHQAYKDGSTADMRPTPSLKGTASHG